MTRLMRTKFSISSANLWIIKAILGVILFCLIFLILPDALLKKARLMAFTYHYKAFFVVILICGCCYLATCVCSYFLNQLMAEHKEQQLKNKIHDRLSLLNLDERALLREFFLQRSSTLIMPIEQHSVQSLLDANILEFAGREINLEELPITSNRKIHVAEFKISLNARRLLKRSQLTLPESDITPRHYNRLKVIRPDFSQMIRRPEPIAPPHRNRRGLARVVTQRPVDNKKPAVS